MNPVHICLANLDNPLHAAGIVDCLDDYARDPMGGGEALADDIKAGIITGLQQHGANATLIALLDDEVIGVAVCMLGYSTFRAKPRLNLHDLAVKPGHRGQGIGRKLLEGVVAHAKAIDCCAVSLEVRTDNARAQTLYRSLGFADCASPMAFWVRPL